MAKIPEEFTRDEMETLSDAEKAACAYALAQQRIADCDGETLDLSANIYSGYCILCYLKEIPPEIQGLEKLKKLDVYETSVDDISPLASLTSLEFLNISGLVIETPLSNDLWSLPHLKRVYMWNTLIVGLPMDIFACDEFENENCLPKVRGYLRSSVRQKNTELNKDRSVAMLQEKIAPFVKYENGGDATLTLKGFQVLRQAFTALEEYNPWLRFGQNSKLGVFENLSTKFNSLAERPVSQAQAMQRAREIQAFDNRVCWDYPLYPKRKKTEFASSALLIDEDSKPSTADEWYRHYAALALFAVSPALQDIREWLQFYL